MKRLISFFLVSFLFLPVFVTAESPANTVLTLMRQIEQLTKQIEILKGQIVRAQAMPTIERSYHFSSTLYYGMETEEVRSLQEFLRKFPEYYPDGLVTGYFGALTERAVKRFQTAHNIDPIGIVGPQTRLKLNEIAKSLAPSVNILFPPPVIDKPIESPLPASEPVNEVLPVADRDVAESDVLFGQEMSLIARSIQESVNQERKAHGLSSLAWDNELSHLALLHSKDQARDNVYTTDPLNLCHYPLIRHEGFEFGLTLKERLENLGIHYRSAGENIALIPLTRSRTYRVSSEGAITCPTGASFNFEAFLDYESKAGHRLAVMEKLRILSVSTSGLEWLSKDWYDVSDLISKSVEGWMNSPGHRRNILTPEYTLGGVGIIRVNDYIIITHNLASR
jgi:uncharacterized protein YkwD